MLSTIDASGVEYGIIPVPKLADDLESKAMSVTTMAIVNPYTSNIAVRYCVYLLNINLHMIHIYVGNEENI